MASTRTLSSSSRGGARCASYKAPQERTYPAVIQLTFLPPQEFGELLEKYATDVESYHAKSEIIKRDTVAAEVRMGFFRF